MWAEMLRVIGPSCGTKLSDNLDALEFRWSETSEAPELVMPKPKPMADPKQIGITAAPAGEVESLARHGALQTRRKVRNLGSAPIAIGALSFFAGTVRRWSEGHPKRNNQ